MVDNRARSVNPRARAYGFAPVDSKLRAEARLEADVA